MQPPPDNTRTDAEAELEKIRAEVASP